MNKNNVFLLIHNTSSIAYVKEEISEELTSDQAISRVKNYRLQSGINNEGFLEQGGPQTFTGWSIGSTEYIY